MSIRSRNIIKLEYLFFIFLIFLNSSCTKVVQDEFDYFEEKPVINSLVVEGQPIHVFTSFSGKLDKDPLKGFDKAVIKLYENDVFKEIIPHSGNGFYRSSVVAKQERKYTIDIEIEDFKEQLTVNTPKQQKILNIEHYNKSGIDADGVICPGFDITFTTNPNKKEYFQIYASTWSSYYSHIPGDAHKPLESSPLYFINIKDPVLLNEGLPILVFSNEMIESSTYTMRVEYNGTKGFLEIDGVFKNILTPLSVELRSIDSAYYHYLKSYFLYERGLTESSIGQVYEGYQVFSNIPGGYGIIGSYSVSKYDTIFPEIE